MSMKSEELSRTYGVDSLAASPFRFRGLPHILDYEILLSRSPCLCFSYQQQRTLSLYWRGRPFDPHIETVSMRTAIRCFRQRFWRQIITRMGAKTKFICSRYLQRIFSRGSHATKYLYFCGEFKQVSPACTNYTSVYEFKLLLLLLASFQFVLE